METPQGKQDEFVDLSILSAEIREALGRIDQLYG